MDIAGIGFVGVMVIGFVNVLTFWKPNMDSKMKIGAAFVFAFVLTFVPADVGSVILQKIVQAVEATAFLSGVYKVAQKAGGA